MEGFEMAETCVHDATPIQVTKCHCYALSTNCQRAGPQCTNAPTSYEVSSLLAIRDICLYHRAFPIRRPVRLSPQVSPVFPIKPGFEYLRSVAKR